MAETNTRLTIPVGVLCNDHGGGGLEIRVPGFKGNPVCPDEGQIFIEYYEGDLRVLVWRGESDPEIITIDIEEGA